jgi:hypothetical protein
VDDKQSTESVREALESTDKVLRRLSRAVESAKDGGDDKQETIALWLRRSRRQLRSNRTLLGEAGSEEAEAPAEDETPKATPRGRGGRRRAAAAGGDGTAAGADGDGADSGAERPRRRAAGARGRGGRRARGGGG